MSYALNNQAQMIITYDQPLVPSNRGCTVTTDMIADDQQYFFYCTINAATNTITI